MNSSAKKVEKEGAIRKFITTSNLYWNSFDFSNIKEMFFSDDEVDRCTVTYGDILMCEGGAYYGRTAIWYYDYDICFQNHVHRLRAYGEISREYFYYVFYFYRNTGLMQSKGTAMPGLSSIALHGLKIPVPPLAEQKRIVAKIEELLPYIDRYEAAWSRLEDFNKRFPTDMQKSILQLAIQGKLVPQRPEEGTGEALYQQSQAEKQSLIRSGKLKKEKPLPEITPDEIPFDIPESWKWVKLPDVADMCLGKMLDKHKNSGTPCQYLRNVNVRWGSFDLNNLLEMKFEDVADGRFLIRENDLVMCEGGEPGRCAVWKDKNLIHFQKALHRIRYYGKIDVEFYCYLFRYYSDSGMLNRLFTGTTIKHLTGQSLNKVIIPLPPYAEQMRIVNKLTEILPQCDRMQKNGG